jgi:hypothetical protein
MSFSIPPEAGGQEACTVRRMGIVAGSATARGRHA